MLRLIGSLKSNLFNYNLKNGIVWLDPDETTQKKALLSYDRFGVSLYSRGKRSRISPGLKQLYFILHRV
jgi:hypothetical protein